MKRTTAFLLGMFILLISLSLEAQSGTKALTLQDVIHPGNVVAPGISALNWRPGGKQLTYVRPTPGKPSASRLCAYDLENHTETDLFRPGEEKEKLNLRSYQWSPRGDAMLLAGEKDLYLLDPQTGGLRRLTQDGQEKEVPTFSPAGDRIAFVRKHNLYVVDVKGGAVRRLTHDGSDTIYNGRLDWVYEEELANRSTARSYEWSPDSKLIAYLRLDDALYPNTPSRTTSRRTSV